MLNLAFSTVFFACYCTFVIYMVAICNKNYEELKFFQLLPIFYGSSATYLLPLLSKIMELEVRFIEEEIKERMLHRSNGTKTQKFDERSH